MNDRITATPLGRQGRVSAVEAEQFAVAQRTFPGGALANHLLPDDIKFVFSHGAGGRFWDTSGNEYIDYCLGSGTLFLGHAHPALVQAVTKQAGRGLMTFAYLNDVAIALAERFCAVVPSAERMRFTNSGSDSTFHAIRLARAFTGKSKILKFEGAYHGGHDYAALSTAPRQSTQSPQPDSAGIPRTVQDLMIVAPFNDLPAARKIIATHAHDLAAVMVEPIQRVLPPQPGFLEGLRALTREHDVLFIMDEVVTGFRYGLGGAQQHFGVMPDLGAYGKILGSGLPVGAVAGRADILDRADPHRRGDGTFVDQNGTLQGFNLGCAVGLAALDVLSAPEVYERVFAMAETLRVELRKIIARHGLPARILGYGPMWHVIFAERDPLNYADLLAADNVKLMKLEHALIREGLFVHPGQRRFVSIAHTEQDLDDTLVGFDRACRMVR
jgi:glutamate-1-semialdehyde 2,1-aminomutase